MSYVKRSRSGGKGTARALAQTQGEMETEKFGETMAYQLRDTLNKVEAEQLVHLQAGTPDEMRH